MRKGLENAEQLIRDDYSVVVSPGWNSALFPMAAFGFEEICFWIKAKSSGGGADTLDYAFHRESWFERGTYLSDDSAVLEYDGASLAYASYTTTDFKFIQLTGVRYPGVRLNLQKSGATSTWTVSVVAIRFRYDPRDRSARNLV
jgi:hypothetical protein